MKAPHLADQVASVINQSKVMGTKTHYVSQFRHYVNFCLDHSINPLQVPLDPHVCTFWIQEKFNMNGNIKSLNQWTAKLNWISDLSRAPKNYKKHPDYVQYISGLRKQYHEGNDHRMPFRLVHLYKYTKSIWKPSKENLKVIGYTNLVKAALANTYFFTMSRPCEFLVSRSAPPRLCGLKVGDFKRILDTEHGVPLIELTINVYKNQASRRIQKKIYICSTKCKRSRNCPCRLCNPYNLLLLMIRRRQCLIDEVMEKLDIAKGVERIRLKSLIEKLRLKPSNNFFIKEDGSPIDTKFLTNIAKDIVGESRILKKENYTAYSLRIGGTTRASKVGVPHPKILKYVGWSAARLADCAQIYIRYSPYELGQIPFQMIHGIRGKKIDSSSKIYDPWSERINPKYFK